MVNSASISSEVDRNQGFIQSNVLSSNSQSSSPITASSASFKNDFTTSHTHLPIGAHAIEPTPTKTDFDGTKNAANDAIRTVKGDSNDKTSFCCSLPLDKVQTVLSTLKPEDEVKSKTKNPRKVLCLFCDRSFGNINLRQKHVERCHSSKQLRRVSLRKNQINITNTPCLYCEKLTETEHTLRELFEHLCISHSNKYFGCLSCEDRFLNSNHLNDHNVSVHRKDVSTIERREDFVKITKNVREEVPVKITRSRLKLKNETSDSAPAETTKVRKKVEVKKTNNMRDLRNKKLSVKTSKIMLKRSKRLQTKVVEPVNKKKRSKNGEKKERQLKQDQSVSTSTKINDKSTKVPSSINPYPEFDSFFRVKKITDHSIDNLKISSLTFDDVFDKAFFNRIRCNIQENLLHHIDGKLFKNEESENRISNFEKISNAPQEVQNLNSENYGCELSLNAVTPATSLLSSQFGEDLESQIEYGSKPSKKKTQIKKDEVHYKYFTRRKYQASILEHKENRDLSKLDMWTQYVIKNRQQKIVDDKKSAQEILEYFSGEEYKNKMRREELNRILDRRGPFEDLKKEVRQKAALDSGKDPDVNDENLSEIRELLNDLLNKVFEMTEETINVSEKVECRSHSKLNGSAEIPSYLNLRRTSSLPNEVEIDKSDKIALICSSQETENFELPTNTIRGKDEKVELTGEWARSRIFVCAACGVKLQNIKQFLEHKSLYHQNVWVQHYEFVGNQSELYRHLSIPVLGKVGVLENTVQAKLWTRSDARGCTKCEKQCNSLGELHRHILECGGDWTWMLARKKCKYRPFGAKSRRKRRGLIKRIYTQKAEPSEKKVYKKAFEGPRPKPSDAETIQRMLANLPAKRATRKIICLKDGINNTRNTQQINKTTQKKKKLKCGKVIHRKLSENNVNDNSETKTHNKTQNFRRSLRTLNKVLSSRILDTNSTLIVKRKYKKKFNKQAKKELKNVETDADDKIVNKNEASRPKRTSPRIENQITSKKIFESMNIKRYFPVRKRKNLGKTRELEAEKDDETIPDLAEVPTSEKYPPDEKKDKNQPSSSLDVDVPPTKDSVEEDTASKNSEISRKRKLRNSFRKVVEKVKKLKVKNNVKPVLEVEKDCLKSEETGNFLAESHALKDDTGPPELEKIVISVPSQEKNESAADPAIPAPIVVNSNMSSVSGTVFDLQTNNEKTLQAKQFDNHNNNSLSVSNSLLSPKSKGKIRKPSRGLNDCIAMLTSKLNKSIEDSSLAVTPSFSSSFENYKSPETDKQDCILKVPLFNEHFQLKPKTDVSKESSRQHQEIIKQITQELPVNMTCKKLNEILKPPVFNYRVQQSDLLKRSGDIQTIEKTFNEMKADVRKEVEQLPQIESEVIRETAGINKTQEAVWNKLNIDVLNDADKIIKPQNLNLEKMCDKVETVIPVEVLAIESKLNNECELESEVLVNSPNSLDTAFIEDLKKVTSKKSKTSKGKRKIGQKRAVTKKAEKEIFSSTAVELSATKAKSAIDVYIDEEERLREEPCVESEDEMPLAVLVKSDECSAVDKVSAHDKLEVSDKKNGVKKDLVKEDSSTSEKLTFGRKRICLKLKPKFLKKRKSHKKNVLEQIDNVIANGQVYKPLHDNEETSVTSEILSNEKVDIKLNLIEKDFDHVEDQDTLQDCLLSSHVENIINETTEAPMEEMSSDLIKSSAIEATLPATEEIRIDDDLPKNNEISCQDIEDCISILDNEKTNDLLDEVDCVQEIDKVQVVSDIPEDTTFDTLLEPEKMIDDYCDPILKAVDDKESNASEDNVKEDDKVDNSLIGRKRIPRTAKLKALESISNDFLLTPKENEKDKENNKETAPENIEVQYVAPKKSKKSKSPKKKNCEDVVLEENLDISLVDNEIIETSEGNPVEEETAPTASKKNKMSKSSKKKNCADVLEENLGISLVDNQIIEISAEKPVEKETAPENKVMLNSSPISPKKNKKSKSQKKKNCQDFVLGENLDSSLTDNDIIETSEEKPMEEETAPTASKKNKMSKSQKKKNCGDVLEEDLVMSLVDNKIIEIALEKADIENKEMLNSSQISPKKNKKSKSQKRKNCQDFVLEENLDSSLTDNDIIETSEEQPMEEETVPTTPKKNKMSKSQKKRNCGDVVLEENLVMSLVDNQITETSAEKPVEKETALENKEILNSSPIIAKKNKKSKSLKQNNCEDVLEESLDVSLLDTESVENPEKPAEEEEEAISDNNFCENPVEDKSESDVRELRRSRRSSKKVASYNEIDLVDPLLDDLENDKNIRQIVEEVWSSGTTIENEFIFKAKKKSAVDVRKKIAKVDKKDLKLNSDELFDLLKSTPSENVVLSKPTSSFFNNFDELSDDFNDDNYDALENILEKSIAVIEEDLAERTESVPNVPEEKVEEGDKTEPELSESAKNKNKKSKKKRSKHRKQQEKLLGKEIECKLDALDGSLTNSCDNENVETANKVENTSTNSTPSPDNKKSGYCEICNKSFARLEGLTKHKRTLTHISKLSELEAKEAEMKTKRDQQNDENTNLSEVIEITSDSSKNDLNLLDMLQTIETNDCKRLESPFSVSVDNSSLKLADIINDVLNKPVLDREIDKHNFSDIIMQNSDDVQPEYRRYRSLGERKSFDAENASTTPKDNVAKTVDYFEPQISKAAGTILEKQITLLQNIIENRSGLSYIDDISVSSGQSANENISSEMNFNNSGQDSNIVYAKPIEVKSSLNEEESFLKPAQYEEISEDSNLRNYEEQKSRKVLNRDEELFLECCSLLKSGSEVSNYSKNSNRLPTNIDLKTCEEPDWLENKSLPQKEPFGIVESYSDTSRMMTPLGDPFENDESNSNTISSNWNMNKTESEKPNKLNADDDSIVFKELDRQEESSKFSGVSKEIKKQFNLLCDKVKKRFRTTSEASSVSSGSYGDQKVVEELSDTSTTDSKKMLTKGAMKVFEGLKVSIPTEDLNMSKLLTCSPPARKTVPNDDASRKRSLSKPAKIKVPKQSKAKSKDKMSSKFAKHKKGDDSSKIHDIYDFEETQDNSDVFTKPDFKSFRSKIEEIRRVDKPDSDNDSRDCNDSLGFEAFSSSTSSVSDSPTKKQKTDQNITKKKCMIMGRIFKNAAKSRIDEDIRNIPVIDNTKLVENFVLNCPEPVPDPAVKHKKMTEEELNLAFDQLLSSAPVVSQKQTNSSPSSKQENKNISNSHNTKKKVKSKTKKKGTNSDSSDDEFSLNTSKRRVSKKSSKPENSCINLEQELKECIGVASRKSQRKCTSGKQNVLVEYWSSDESSFEALLESQILYNSVPSETVDQTPQKQAECATVNKLPDVMEVEKPISKTETEEEEEVLSNTKEKPIVTEKKPQKKSKHNDMKRHELNSNRRKRAAANPLYHWSSSSEDESYDLIEVKPIRDELEDDDDRPIQHGWIVGDSPKKLVTMLAQAKGKKCDVDGVKEQGKKRTNAFS